MAPYNVETNGPPFPEHSPSNWTPCDSLSASTILLPDFYSQRPNIPVTEPVGLFVIDGTPDVSQIAHKHPQDQVVRPQRHVARPPNAFMLFRSHFLKQGTIPKSVEKRQQALSKVVGEVWGMMSAEEKMIWHLEAAKKQREHKEKYPNYKFIPSPRGRRSNKDCVHNNTAVTAQERTKQLRELYTNFLGPSPVSSGKKRLTKDRGMHPSLPYSPMPSAPVSLSLLNASAMSADKIPDYVGGQDLKSPFDLHQCPAASQQPSTVFDFKGELGSGQTSENSETFDVAVDWPMNYTSGDNDPIHLFLASAFPPPPVNLSVSVDETEIPCGQFPDSTFLDLDAKTYNQAFLDAMSYNQVSSPSCVNYTFPTHSDDPSFYLNYFDFN